MWTKIKLRLTCVYDTCSKPAAIIETWYGSKSGANGPSTYWSFCGAKLLRLLRASVSFQGANGMDYLGCHLLSRFMFPF